MRLKVRVDIKVSVRFKQNAIAKIILFKIYMMWRLKKNRSVFKNICNERASHEKVEDLHFLKVFEILCRPKIITSFGS